MAVVRLGEYETVDILIKRFNQMVQRAGIITDLIKIEYWVV